MRLPYTAAEEDQMRDAWRRHEALKAKYERLRDQDEKATAIAEQRDKDSKDIRDDIKRGM